MKIMTNLLLVLLLGACGKKDDKDDECQPGQPCFVRDVALNVDNVSETDGLRSHNEGQNCMECHQDRGPGKGKFQVAGTLLNADGTPAKGAKLVLYKDAAHTDAALTVEVDRLGNFFSTESTPFPADTYPVLTSADGTKSIAMPWPTASGACNMCHVGYQKLKFD